MSCSARGGFQVKTCIQRDETGLRSKSRGRSRPAMVGRTDDPPRARAARSPLGGAAACQRRCSACLAMGYVRAPRSRQKRSRLLASVQPWSLQRAGRPLPLRPRSVVAPASRRPARRHHNWRQGRPRRCGRNPPGAHGAVPSAEARPVSAPSPIAGSAYRPTSSKRSRAGSWLYLRPSKRGREASNATCWRLWSRPASATGGGAHDSAASGATMAHPLNPGLNQRRPHSLRSRTDVKVTESFRASRDCPGRAFHSPLSDETGPPPPQRAAVSRLNELMSRAGHASKRP